MPDKVVFEFDEPIVLHLRFPQGRLIDRQPLRGGTARLRIASRWQLERFAPKRSTPI